MANRIFNAFNYTLEKETVTLYGDVTIGSVGAPSLVSTQKNKGIKSIVRNGAGDYTVTFSDQYVRLLAFWVGFIKTAGGAPAAANMIVKAVSPTAAGGATVEFILYNGASATDPASGEELYLEVTWSNTNTP